MIPRRVPLLMVTAVMAAALLLPAGCESKKDASGVAEDYIDLFAAGDFEAAYQLLAEESYEKQNWTIEQYVRKSRSTYGGPYEVTNIVFKPQDKKEAQVSFIIQGGLRPTDGAEDMVLGGEITMVDKGSEWKVQMIEWAAVPEGQVPYNVAQ